MMKQNFKRIIKNLFLGLIRLPYNIRRHNHYNFLYTRVASDNVMTNCKLGKYCHIGRFGTMNHVNLGNYCSIANDVHIGGMEHSWWSVSTSSWLTNEQYYDCVTNIGNDVWIGVGAIVRQGVTIGDGAVIGANSFVNKDIPPYAIAVGSPAKVIRYRFPETIQNAISETNLLNMDVESAGSEINKIIHLFERRD